MNTKIVLLVVITLIVNSCNKSDFSTKPHLSLVSVNTTRLVNDGDNLIFTFNFNDKQGQVDTLFMKRCTLVCSDTSNTNYILKKTLDTLLIPAYPSTSYQKGQITFNCVYSGVNGTYENLNSCIDSSSGASKTDTSYFLFCLRDAAGHLSDTVKSPKITFVKN